jgi:hypothetical protein
MGSLMKLDGPAMEEGPFSRYAMDAISNGITRSLMILGGPSMEEGPFCRYAMDAMSNGITYDTRWPCHGGRAVLQICD